MINQNTNYQMMTAKTKTNGGELGRQKLWAIVSDMWQTTVIDLLNCGQWHNQHLLIKKWDFCLSEHKEYTYKLEKQSWNIVSMLEKKACTHMLVGQGWAWSAASKGQAYSVGIKHRKAGRALTFWRAQTGIISMLQMHQGNGGNLPTKEPRTAIISWLEASQGQDRKSVV